ncbi:methylamine methyltransferase corrinoid protein reductive activase [Desulfogranum japonicum]|uniref:methylamine methyltransferase corrinoid protein reductive activase n=1 Tax=Desulfogranum japonicum TaxID=231447 RepID=UPI0003F6BBEC|nr:methylamine methyltransferase corrinoid protein reductive activase [Desulfogranum japonicum]
MPGYMGFVESLTACNVGGEMDEIGVAVDIGTSGIRAQAVDLTSGAVLSTSISLAHPLPGANVVDHLHFALEAGVTVATRMLRTAVNRVVEGLKVPVIAIRRLAVCGNTVQLSLLQGIEVRDLAYTGARKLATLGVVKPDRRGVSIQAGILQGLELNETCQVLIPPAVCHTIGADALAMVLQSGILQEQQTALITDYGTNAEMALYHNGRIITASAAAGPAIEGQQISCGMLAAPGAVTDLQLMRNLQYRLLVLDEQMQVVQGPVVDLERASLVSSNNAQVKGITGTGVVAALCEGIQAGLIELPCIQTPDACLHLGRKLSLTEEDLQEAGKAFGAIRAGHVTLCHEAGIGYGDIHVVYMAGAAGTYVDPVKAMFMGWVPAYTKKIVQVGNTSLKMARHLVMDPAQLDVMQRLADRIRPDHYVLAASDTFKKMYMLELAYWTEGMPMTSYRTMLTRYGVKAFPETVSAPEILQAGAIGDLGNPGVQELSVVSDPGEILLLSIEGCTACSGCVDACPQSALELSFKENRPVVQLYHSRCAGVSCKRCEHVCPEKVMVLSDFFMIR